MRGQSREVQSSLALDLDPEFLIERVIIENLDVLFRTVSRGSLVPWGGVPGSPRVSSQKVQRVREG